MYLVILVPILYKFFHFWPQAGLNIMITVAIMIPILQTLLYQKTLIFETKVNMEMRSIRGLGAYWSAVDEKTTCLARTLEKLDLLIKAQIDICQAKSTHERVEIMSETGIPTTGQEPTLDSMSYAIENGPLFQDFGPMPNMILVKYHTVIFANSLTRDFANYIVSFSLRSFSQEQISELLRSIFIAIASYRDAIIAACAGGDISCLQKAHIQHFNTLMNTEAPRWGHATTRAAYDSARRHEITTGDSPVDWHVRADSYDYLSKKLNSDTPNYDTVSKEKFKVIKMLHTTQLQLRREVMRHMYTLEKVYKCTFTFGLFPYQPHLSHPGLTYDNRSVEPKTTKLCTVTLCQGKCYDFYENQKAP